MPRGRGRGRSRGRGREMGDYRKSESSGVGQVIISVIKSSRSYTLIKYSESDRHWHFLWKY